MIDQTTTANAPRTVYVRPGALVLQRAVTRGTARDVDAARQPRDPDADRALQTLREIGLRVTITEAGGAASGIGAGDWLLTDSVDDCRWARQAGVRSVLVGGPTNAATLPERCDRSVSSLYRAALEIVVAESVTSSTDSSSS